MIDLNLIRRAWIWWLGEIRGLGAHIFPPCSTLFPAFNIVSLDGPGDPAGRVNPRKPLAISVDIARCFVHKLVIPASARPQLKALLQLETLRITPFSRADILTGWVEARAPSAGELAITHVVLRRDVVQPMLDRMKTGRPQIVVQNQDGTLIRMADAEPPPPEPGESTWRRLAVLSGSTALFAVVFAGYSILTQLDLELAAITSRTVIAAKDAAIVRERLQALADSSRQVASLKSRKQTQIPVLAIWAELTNLMPDDAWLTSLSIDGEAISIDGSARAAEPLIPVLDNSPLFQSVAFAGPVTTASDNNTVRFSIHMNRSGGQR